MILNSKLILFSSDVPSDLTEPDAISDLNVWFEARKETYSNNDAVDTFTDQSGNSKDRTQATASKQCTFVTQAINGQPAYEMDGTDGEYDGTDIITTESSHTAFLLWAANGTTDNYIFCNGTMAGGGDYCFYYFDGGVGPGEGWLQYVSGGSTQSSEDQRDWANDFRLDEIVRSGTSVTFRKDGREYAYTVQASHTGTLTIDQWIARGAAFYPSNGSQLAMFLAYNKVLNNSERNVIYDYVRSIYGINI